MQPKLAGPSPPSAEELERAFQLPAAPDRAKQEKTPAISLSPLEEFAMKAIRLSSPGGLVRDFWKDAIMNFITKGARPGENEELKELRKKGEQELQKELANMDGDTANRVDAIRNTVVAKARDLSGISSPADFHQRGYFDPIGFSITVTESSKLLFFREVDMKQDGVVVLASLGILVGEQFMPLSGGSIEVPPHISFQETPLQDFWPAVVAAALAIPEVYTVVGFSSESWSDPLPIIAATGLIAQDLATGLMPF
jgi:hypothetical protein